MLYLSYALRPGAERIIEQNLDKDINIYIGYILQFHHIIVRSFRNKWTFFYIYGKYLSAHPLYCPLRPRTGKYPQITPGNKKKCQQVFVFFI